MFLCCGYCGTSAWFKTRENIKDFWRHDVSVALRNHCHGMHVGPGICDTVLRDGCGIGIGVYADEVVLCVLRCVYWLVGSGADRERYGVERVIWRAAAHYSTATESKSNLNVRHEQRRRRDGQTICIATAATNQVGNEGSIFRFVFWHSVALAAIIGVIVMLYAYVFPQFIPHGLSFVH